MTVNILYTYKDAYNIGVKYVPEVAFPRDFDQRYPYDVTVAAFTNTMKYIFHYLHHQCYMLCVKNNVNTIYKLQPTTTAPIYKRILKNALNGLSKNDTLTKYQRNYITRTITGPAEIRLMQCIVKQIPGSPSINSPTDSNETTNEYLTLLKDVNLPNGVYILNLTDAVILREDGTHPFPIVVGPNVSIGKYAEEKHIPIFSISGQHGYMDIQIPNYDDIMIVLGTRPDIQFDKFVVTWKDKMIERAVFRGGASGCGYTSETNARIKLATISSPYIDAGITVRSGKTIDSMAIKFDSKYGIGMMNTGIKPVPFMSMIEQSRHKYIIHVDGNVSAYRLVTTMATGSLILRVMSEYTTWFDVIIQSGKHYLPIKPDLSNLEDTIIWCRNHDKECQSIAENGKNAAEWAMSKDNIVNITQFFIWRAVVPTYNSTHKITFRRTIKKRVKISSKSKSPERSILQKHNKTYKSQKNIDDKSI